MPVDSIHHRRSQADFAAKLKGWQPAQQHAKAQRFGRATPLLRLDNVPRAFTGMMLLGSLRPALAQELPQTTPALLPGVSAVRTEAYSAVPQAMTLEEVGTKAAVGCLLRPTHCGKILGGAALVAVTSGALGGLLGWEARRQWGGEEARSSCDDATPINRRHRCRFSRLRPTTACLHRYVSLLQTSTPASRRAPRCTTTSTVYGTSAPYCRQTSRAGT